MAVQQQQVPGLTRTDLEAGDLSVPGYEMIQNRVEIDPSAPTIRHWHPGEEIICVELATYVVEKGKPLLNLTTS
jgi:quercetin dioxygenase-like cupin family protein